MVIHHIQIKLINFLFIMILGCDDGMKLLFLSQKFRGCIRPIYEKKNKITEKEININ